MGLLSFLGIGSQQVVEPAKAKPDKWQQRFAELRSWEDDPAVGPLLVTEFLQEFAAKWTNSRIVTDEDSESSQLRGTLNNRALRLKVDQGGSVELDAKLVNRVGMVTLHWNPEKVPKSKDDDWDDDEIRIFVGKEVFIEGNPKFIDDEVAAFGLLASTEQQMITGAMAQLKIDYAYLSDDHLSVSFVAHVGDMSDPIAEINRGIDFVARLCGLLEAGVNDLSDAPKVLFAREQDGAHPRFLKCSYCGSKRPASLTNCPNCGAV